VHFRIEFNMVIRVPNCSSAMPVGKDAGGGLEDVSLNVVDHLAVAADDKPQEDLLHEVVGLSRIAHPSAEVLRQRSASGLRPDSQLQSAFLRLIWIAPG
jgi:hypothetical protein